jgi:hypothetical protein
MKAKEDSSTLRLSKARKWTLTIQPQYRIRVHATDFRQALDFIVPELGSLTVYAGIGTEGQVQLFHPESEIAKSRLALEGRLSTAPLTGADSVTRRGAYLRYVSGLWTVSIDEDTRNRLTIKLPKEALDLDLLPQEGKMVIMFGSGELLEIWRLAEWVQSAKKTHSSALVEGLPSTDDA